MTKKELSLKELIVRDVKTAYFEKMRRHHDSTNREPYRLNEGWFDSCCADAIHQQKIYYHRGRDKASLSYEELGERRLYGLCKGWARKAMLASLNSLKENEGQYVATRQKLMASVTKQTPEAPAPVQMKQEQLSLGLICRPSDSVKERLKKLRDALASRPGVHA